MSEESPRNDGIENLASLRLLRVCVLVSYCRRLLSQAGPTRRRRAELGRRPIRIN